MTACPNGYSGASGYTSGCRCAACREAWSAYHREYRKRRAANEGKPLRGPSLSAAERARRTRERKAARPEAARAAAINSRTKSMGAKGRVTERELKSLIAAYRGRCAYCSRPFEVIDHFVPLAHAGTSWIDNLRPACQPCNQHKLAKSLDEWKPWIRNQPPPHARRRLMDLLRGVRPQESFGADAEGRLFTFPTAGWDSWRPQKSNDGLLTGRGFYLSADLHIPLIEEAGGVITKVVGVTFSKDLASPGLAAGRIAILVPEPDNPHDPHAVGVWDSYVRHRAGWIPAAISETVSTRIEAGDLTHARITWEWLVDDRRTGLQILIAPGFPKPRLVFESDDGHPIEPGVS